LNGIAVTGATGFIGRHLINRLLDNAEKVRILTRAMRQLPDGWNDRLDVVQGDLADPAKVSAFLNGCKIVYHLASELKDPSRLQMTNVQGTKTLLDACEEARVERVVHLSSVGVIGATQAGKVDERASCLPRNDYEKSKYCAEQLAIAWSQRTNISLIVLRPTIVFGDGPRSYSGQDSMLAWLRAIKAKRFVNFDRKAIANYIYVGDVVAACLLAARAKSTGTFIVADSCPLCEFMAAAAKALNCPAPRIFIPWQIGYMLAIALQMLEFPRGRNAQLTTARVRALSSRTEYDAGRLRSVLEWQPKTGLREGLRLTVEWYRRNGMLA
jgi:nucleoside-diphosphate-sugar epimerase